MGKEYEGRERAIQLMQTNEGCIQLLIETAAGIDPEYCSGNTQRAADTRLKIVKVIMSERRIDAEDAQLDKVEADLARVQAQIEEHRSGLVREDSAPPFRIETEGSAH